MKAGKNKGRKTKMKDEQIKNRKRKRQTKRNK